MSAVLPGEKLHCGCVRVSRALETAIERNVAAEPIGLPTARLCISMRYHRSFNVKEASVLYWEGVRRLRL